MRLVLYLVLLFSSFSYNTVLALQQPKKGSALIPKNYSPFVTLNAQKGCKVHVAAWLSPSCSHCAEYFSTDIPKITSLPGFCLDLHLVPYLYLLDKPVAILIASEGTKNLLKNAAIFFRHQNDWLDKSATRESKEDREEDLGNFLKSIEIGNDEIFNEIKDYLDADDRFLYVKMFALKFFSIKHLKKYLPKGDEELINDVSISLVSNLPKKDNDIVKYSPFFTDTSGQLIPDEYLHNGILTPSVAEDMLKAADSSINTSTKIATRTTDLIDDEEDIQDADELNEETVEDEENTYNIENDPELSKKLGNILEKIETTE